MFALAFEPSSSSWLAESVECHCREIIQHHTEGFGDTFKRLQTRTAAPIGESVEARPPAVRRP